MLKRISPLSWVLVIFFGTTGVAVGQSIHLPPAVRQGPDTSSVPVHTQAEADQARTRELFEQRQEEIKRDTQRLVELSAELKDFVEKGNRGVLSLDAAKKAEQIEKLARSVKSKIKLMY
jgi:hypothetical protein